MSKLMCIPSGILRKFTLKPKMCIPCGTRRQMPGYTTKVSGLITQFAIEGFYLKWWMPKKWSDHAALTLTLQEQPAMPLHPPPAISSRNMKQFQEDQTQTKLTALFSRGVAASTETLVIGDRWYAPEGSLGQGGNSATSLGQPAAGEDTGVDGRESPAPGPVASVKQQEDGGADDRIGETKLGADVVADDSPCLVCATTGGKPVGAITCAKKPAIQAPKKGRGSNKRKEAPVASSKQKSLRSFFKETNPASS